MLGSVNQPFGERIRGRCDGPLQDKGMPDLSGTLSLDDIETIKAFIQGTAHAIRPKPVNIW
jgi:quinohemoprotein ethanol dehydrogenase